MDHEDVVMVSRIWTQDELAGLSQHDPWACCGGEPEPLVPCRQEQRAVRTVIGMAMKAASLERDEEGWRHLKWLLEEWA